MFETATAIRIDERDLLDELEAGQLAVELDDATPQEMIAWALERWGSQVAICTSFQAEGMAILDMAWRIDPKVRLFTVDTGRLHQETYDVMETVRHRYGIQVEARETRGAADNLRMLRDPAQPERMQTRYDSGDHIHPNDEGYRAMAQAVPLAWLGCQARNSSTSRKQRQVFKRTGTAGE